MTIRREVTRAIKASPKKRQQIADEMAELTGLRVTIAMINDYSSDSHADHRFPLNFVPSFCAATGSDRLVRLIVKEMGLHIINDKEAQMLRLAKLEMGADKIAREIVRVKQELR